MGSVVTEVELSNPREPRQQPVVVNARADTGSMMLCVPDGVAQQLGVELESMRNVEVADGRRASVPYVGPVQVRFGNRTCFVGALVMGNEVRLGAVPMEDMDLVVNPKLGTVTVNPASPDAPLYRA
ncbi:MAG: clan AA aspartic protease [Gammaproteobacteria bacterium]|nr:clan AA aspartic protease [Gammaproteobacteria bacterium]MYF29380.1 clan AA aspartic protease [Gammaproteobacteria bacterium]MYK47937.1 clan AA aspartic protease [Gammaproteobacteria bacterium]